MQKVAIFGSTGSIGTSTLEVLRLHREQFEVFALTAHSNLNLLTSQCQEFQPRYAIMHDSELALQLQTQLNKSGIATEVLTGVKELGQLAAHPEVDIVMSAIVGSAGLIPTYQAALSGKRILLANKESLVAGGSIIIDAVRKGNAQLIPVDSEHSAIYQALPYNFESLSTAGVNKIILTASGGPFLNTPQEILRQVTAAEAVKHPNWSMGQKISVDSATLMNKGLEVIEAYWLFNATFDQLEVVVHPQSIIHSMVEYVDGSILAQLGTPDMKTPIAYALSAPKRIISGSKNLNFWDLNALTFAKPDLIRFPCLQLALDGLKAGGSVPAIINASNEIAVSKFLAGKIRFYDIPHMIEKAVTALAHIKLTGIDTLLALDIETREYCLKV